MAQRDPSAITDMMIDNGDGTYTVRFYKNGVARYVTVDRYLPSETFVGYPEDYELGFLVYQGAGGYIGADWVHQAEIWAALIEKAYAQINEEGWIGQDGKNSYQQSTSSASGISGGWMAPVYSQLLGVNATSMNISSNTSSSTMTSLINYIQSGHMITAATNTTGSNATSLNLVYNHVYVITDYDPILQTFKMYNPWGPSYAPGHIDSTTSTWRDLSWNEIKSNFQLISLV